MQSVSATVLVTEARSTWITATRMVSHGPYELLVQLILHFSQIIHSLFTSTRQKISRGSNLNLMLHKSDICYTYYQYFQFYSSEIRYVDHALFTSQSSYQIGPKFLSHHLEFLIQNQKGSISDYLKYVIIILHTQQLNPIELIAILKPSILKKA